MGRRGSLSRGEAALERLLERIDDAIDEYTHARRSRHTPLDWPRGDEDGDERFDRSWAAWWALPLSIRDWLLWYVPDWWALAPGVFRRFLLITARLIVRNGLAPRIALRRAATRLRLPPPRRTTRLARTTTRRSAHRIQTAAVLARRDRTRRFAGRAGAASRRTPATARSRAPLQRSRAVRTR